VQLADTVALLDGGVIAAHGTHAELLASQPRYAGLMCGPGAGGRPGGTSVPAVAR
jgi:ABC-type multidrug transport system fused ATPase/permease subunit